jgi:hypothetical protein
LRRSAPSRHSNAARVFPAFDSQIYGSIYPQSGWA